MKLSEKTDIPVLEGWVNITEAAELLSLTRQHVFRKATQDGFKSLHRIGTQPVFVLSTAEIQDILNKRQVAGESVED